MMRKELNKNTLYIIATPPAHFFIKIIIMGRMFLLKNHHLLKWINLIY